jgi:hypothetical protein
MYYIGDYFVPVESRNKIPFKLSAIPSFTQAKLELAKKEDMPAIGGSWTFAWQEFWDKTDFECEYIIKLTYNNHLLGLVRFAVYSREDNTPYLVEVLHLECISDRLIYPVGRWLLWYVVQVGVKFCVIDENETLVILDSTEKSKPYYEDIVGMEPLGWTTLAPGEDGYAFRFTYNDARVFLQRQTSVFGFPEKAYSRTS